MKNKAIFPALLSALFSGALLAASVYPLQWKPLCWFGLVPLLTALFSSGFRRGLLLGTVTGAVYFSVFLSWISYYSPVIVLMALPLAIVFATAFGGLTAYVAGRLRSPLAKAFVPAMCWTALEFIYSITPLGSAFLQLESIPSLPMLAAAAFAGKGVITFALVLSNGLLASYFVHRAPALKKAILLFVLVIAAWNAWGWKHIQRSEGTNRLRVAVAQPNFPIEPEWRVKHSGVVFETYRAMAAEAAAGGAQLVIFPQFKLPEDVYRNPEKISEIVKQTGIFMILGTYTQNTEGPGQYNIALLFSPDGKIAGEYRAVRPPPFRRIGQIRGKKTHVVDTPLGKLGIMLCYDDVEPASARELVQAGAEVLISVSNDGHFRDSKQPYLHFTTDRLRAAETDRYVIRAATTGISAFITPSGGIKQMTRTLERKIIWDDVFLKTGETPSVRWGDWFTPSIALLFLLLSAAALLSYNFLR